MPELVPANSPRVFPGEHVTCMQLSDYAVIDSFVFLSTTSTSPSYLRGLFFQQEAVPFASLPVATRVCQCRCAEREEDRRGGHGFCASSV